MLFRQFLIPEGNCQLPDQNYAADQTAKDKVECNNTYCPGNSQAHFQAVHGRARPNADCKTLAGEKGA